MTLSRFLFYGSLALIIVTSGCRPLYRSSIPDVPMLREKKQLDAKVGLETGTGYFNANYAITDRFLVTAGGSAWSNSHTSAQFGEVGLGYFRYYELKEFGWNAVLTSGFGDGSVIDNVQTADLPDNEGGLTRYDSQYLRIAFQPGFYFTGEKHSLALGLRTSGLQWFAPTSYREREAGGIDLYAEPVLSFRYGTDAVKVFGETSLLLPLIQSFDHPIIPLHIGLGMSFTISRRALGLPIKEKPNEQ